MGLFGSNIKTGIDIGASSIKVVQISLFGKQPKLISAGMLEFHIASGNESIGANLRYLLSERNIKADKVITQMPGKDITIRSFTLPRMPASELCEAVRWEAKRHISYPLESAVIEYLITGQRHEGTVDKLDILLVACERDAVAQHCAPFEEAKIKLSAIDANALALRNVFHLLDKPSDMNTVVVDIGAGKTEIDIFKGGVPRFSRCLDIGGIDMTRAIAEALNVNIQKAEDMKREMHVLASSDNPGVAAVRTILDGLMMEIRRSADYYKTTFREKNIHNILLTGGVSLMPGIREYVMKSVDGTVEIDQPFEGLSGAKNVINEFSPLAPRFSVAIGLALRKARV
ncbi:MAG: type IV pilus assembly protein PilM [Nitrospirota bacterium]